MIIFSSLPKRSFPNSVYFRQFEEDRLGNIPLDDCLVPNRLISVILLVCLLTSHYLKSLFTTFTCFRTAEDQNTKI